MSSGKVTIVCLMAGLMKKILYKMSYYPKPDNNSRNKLKVEV